MKPSGNQLSIKAVFFDFDETLVDSKRGQMAAHSAVTAKIRVQTRIPLDAIKLRRLVTELDEEMDRKGLFNRDEWWSKLFLRLGISLSDNKFVRELTRIYWREYGRNSPPYRDTQPILRYLRSRGYKLGIVTNTDGTPSWKRRRLAASGLSGFDVIVVAGEDCRALKPKPEPFRLAAHLIGVDVNSCLMVGDKPHADVEGAKKAGMMTALVLRRNWEVTTKPDIVVRGLIDLKRLL